MKCRGAHNLDIKVEYNANEQTLKIPDIISNPLLHSFQRSINLNEDKGMSRDQLDWTVPQSIEKLSNEKKYPKPDITNRCQQGFNQLSVVSSTICV